MGEKVAELIPMFLVLHTGHVHIHKVLHGVPSEKTNCPYNSLQL